MDTFEPGYLNLYRSGELAKRAGELKERLSACKICPHNCGVNRLAGERGFCHSAYLPAVSSFCAHRGEEPPVSGSCGSGTIFFGNCNMRCVYCQNYQISQDWKVQQGNEVSIRTLAADMLVLQDRLKCHNINLVTPSHFVPQIIEALLAAVPEGLHVPLVYNTSGYDSVETLRLLEGIIDIYLPDIRYADNRWAKEYSGVPDYLERDREAIKEMYRQVGNLVVDENGVARRGLIVRHLILPEDIAGSEDSLRWLAGEVSPDVALSVMAQYYPANKAGRITALSRRIKYEEYSKVVSLLRRLDLNNGWVQEMDAPENYRPDFALEGHPFEG
jgi:putative pyruvate formate lyase activating enzyme